MHVRVNISSLTKVWSLLKKIPHKTFLFPLSTEIITIHFFFLFFLAVPSSLWDLSSLIMDQTCTPCLAGHRACACAHARTDRCAQTGHLSCSLIPWVYLCLGVGLRNHTLLPLLVPSGTSIFFSIPALPMPIPTHRGGEFPLLHIFSSTGY